MNKLSSFPKDPARSLRAMDILIDLDAVADNRSIIGLSIRIALDEKEPVRVIFDSIKSTAADNYWAVADIIGYKLLDKIIAFK